MKVQIQIEREMLNRGYDAYQSRLKSASQVLPLDLQWVRDRTPAFRSRLESYLSRPVNGPVMAEVTILLKALDLDMVAVVCLKHTLLTVTRTPGCSYQTLAKGLGAVLDDLYAWESWVKAQESKVVNRVRAKGKKLPGKIQKLFSERLADPFKPQPYDQDREFKVGAQILEMMVESVPELTPTAEKNMDVFRFNQDLFTDLMANHEEEAKEAAVFLPMVETPVPWSATESGGYLTRVGRLKQTFVRSRHQDHVAGLNKAQMDEVYQAINTMQETPWRINLRVLDVINRLPVDVRGRLFPSPKDLERPEGEDKKAQALYFYQRTQAQSKEVQANLTLACAKEFKDYESIYFPYNLDWRGRVYPLPSYISPQGSDLAKGLLEFSEAKQIRDFTGAKWLMVHGANCWANGGLDKAPFGERVQWVQEHVKDITKVASDPIKNLWWTEAEDPFQFLAWCFEYAGYLLEGNTFESHLCVSVDGSCNGLQHFAAILRDPKGGYHVNLVPSDRPQDIYSIIAKTVATQVDQEAQAGDEMAQVWAGKVDRKIVKRNVMTQPYGVTKQGMGDQIMAELKGKGADYLDTDQLFKASRYLASKVYEALGQEMAAAVEVMDWFKACAKVFNEANQPATWVTPTGFPARQIYYRTKSKEIRIYFETHRLRRNLKADSDKIDSVRQVNGISPNVIHSLDASHLVRTVNAARKKGIKAFGMVHDSYGCHAGDMATMANILRQEFVRLYSGNVLEDLKDQWAAQLPAELAAKLPDPPKQMGLDVSIVETSHYFFA